MWKYQGKSWCRTDGGTVVTVKRVVADSKAIDALAAKLAKFTSQRKAAA